MDRLRLAQLHSKETIADRKIEILNKLDINYCVLNEPSPVSLFETFLGYNCLHIAVIRSDLNLTRHLLNLGVDIVKQGTRDGKTPLHKVVADKKYSEEKSIWEILGHLQKDQIVDVLLSTQVKNNITINPKCKDGVSHLHIACMFNHIEAVEFFANAGEPLDQATNENNDELPGYTALHFAVRYSSVEAVEILLRKGANVHLKNTHGHSPLQLMITCLLDYNECLTKGIRAVSLPYEQEVQRLNLIINSVLETRKPDDAFFIDVTGLSAFHLACTLRDDSKARYYLESNVDMNLTVKDLWPGWTPLHFAACLNIQTLNLLIQRGANFDSKNEEGYTALDLFLKNHNPEAVSTVLSSNNAFTNILLSDASTKLTDVIFAMHDCQRFENFLDNLTDVNIFVPFDCPIWPGYSILHLAISMNERIKPWEYFASRTDQVKRKVNPLTTYTCTLDEQLLYWKIIGICLAKGCNVCLKDADNLSPIHLAFKWHRSKLVKLLLGHCQQNVTDPNNLSLLHIACASGKLEAVEKFIEQGADVNDRVASSFEWHDRIYNSIDEYKPEKIRMELNSTPLHIAAMFGHINIAAILIERGGDLYAKDELGLTPIHLTMGLGQEVHDVQHLVFNTPNLRDSVSDAGLSHLHTAVYHENEVAVERLLQAGANVNGVVGKQVSGMQMRFAGETPLHMAGYSAEMIRLLVRYGADVTVENPFDKFDTPLIDKLFECELDISLAEGLKNSMETGPFDSNGMTRLHIACATFQVNWAKQLLEAGADPNAQVSCSKYRDVNLTPLHFLLNYADFSEHGMPRQTVVDQVKLLLRYGADVFRNDGTKGPLHVVYRAIWSRETDSVNNRAARERRSFRRIADMMLDTIQDFSVNPEDENGFSPLHFACVRNKPKIIEKFLDSGIDVNYSTYPFVNEETAGHTPLHFAVRHGSAQAACLLIERGADVSAQDRYGNTPLHSLVDGKHLSPELVDILLNRGADINAKNLQNETPIERLVYYLQFSNNSLQLLLDRRATIDIRKRAISGERIIGLAINNAMPGEKEIVLKTFIDHCNIERAIKSGFHAIHSVVSVKDNYIELEMYLKTIQKFVEMGNELDEINSQGNTALRTAISFDNLEAMEALLLLGADLNLVEKKNKPSLIMKVINKINGDLSLALFHHMWKMNTIGLKLVSSIKSAVEDFEWTPNPHIMQRCQGELKRAKATYIAQSLKLDIFLSEWKSVICYPMMSIIQRQDVNAFFKQSRRIFQNFPEFAGLMMMHYRKALARMKLMQPAKEILMSSNVNLPDLCLEEILKNLNNVELDFLVESDEFIHPRKRQRVE